MKVDVARAWKDQEYRKTLSAEQLASLPPNPAGSASLSEADLDKVSGGGATAGATGTFCTIDSCCLAKLPDKP
jgi:mersacidin/lichenicidin family type 2 lantibiotic